MAESSGDGGSCGLTTDAIRNAAIRPLLDGGIKVSAAEPGDNFVPWLNVVVTALRPSATTCAADVLVSLDEHCLYVPSHRVPLSLRGQSGSSALVGGGQPKSLYVAFGIVRLLTDGAVMTGSPATFPGRVSDEIRHYVEGFVTKIKLENQG